MILSLLKILFPNLCLFLMINMCSKIHEGYRCVDWLFRLVSDQSVCERKFGFIYVILFCYVLILYLLARDAYNFVS
jgi:hypothetical protein